MKLSQQNFEILILKINIEAIQKKRRASYLKTDNLKFQSQTKE